jgi:hypothetical protein
MDAVLPAAVVIVALLLLGILLRLLVRPGKKQSETAPSLPGKLSEKELDDRIEDELRNLED